MRRDEYTEHLPIEDEPRIDAVGEAVGTESEQLASVVGEELQEEVQTDKSFTPAELERGFISSVSFEDVDASCLVICCSDHRFRRQTIEFLRRLGYDYPHVISLPGSVAVIHSLAAAIGFLSKAVNRLVDKAVELTGVTEIICIAHEDCGGYKAGRVKLIGKFSRRLAGGSIQEIQLEHLEKAARSIELSTGVNVRTFFAGIVDSGENRRVLFKEIQRRRRSRRPRVA